jgi:hypothetical protein
MMSRRCFRSSFSVSFGTPKASRSPVGGSNNHYSVEKANRIRSYRESNLATVPELNLRSHSSALAARVIASDGPSSRSCRRLGSSSRQLQFIAPALGLHGRAARCGQQAQNAEKGDRLAVVELGVPPLGLCCALVAAIPNTKRPGGGLASDLAVGMSVHPLGVIRPCSFVSSRSLTNSLILRAKT